jgi:cell wall-associated NlpC family hydrolase
VIDRRLTLVRDGLADVRLEGLVAAERFAAAVPMQVAAPTASLRKAASPEAEQENQLLFGERFDVLFEDGDFAFGQARRDGYVGYVAQRRPGPAGRPADPPRGGDPHLRLQPAGHQVGHRRALQRQCPGYGRGAGRSVREGRRLGLDHRGPSRPIGTGETDYVAVAQRFLGAPYQWGGRESLGLDCSALVQLSLAACNRACPRDTDMQRGFFAEIAEADRRRGDLVFWKGHVAVLLDADTILHANAFHMAVAVEPLAEAIAGSRRRGSGRRWGIGASSSPDASSSSPRPRGAEFRIRIDDGLGEIPKSL